MKDININLHQVDNGFVVEVDDGWEPLGSISKIYFDKKELALMYMIGFLETKKDY